MPLAQSEWYGKVINLRSSWNCEPFSDADSLANKEGIRQHQHHLSVLIGLEDQFVLTISLTKCHRTYGLPALWLTIRTRELWNFNVAVVNRGNCKLPKQ